MQESFSDVLTAGGKSNSLGRTAEVIDAVFSDPSRIAELYACTLDEDAWVRMRAIDAVEKICRQHPEWILPYIDRFTADLHASNQPSIQWHLAQIYRQITLTPRQKVIIINWLQHTISSADVDWIAAANIIDTLMMFVRNGDVSENEMIPLLLLQKKHKSNAVIKRANKYLSELTPE